MTLLALLFYVGLLPIFAETQKYLTDASCYDSAYRKVSYKENDALYLGNPTKATENNFFQRNLLLRHDTFSISYNNVLHIPNWVAWHLCSSDVGTSSRYDGDFFPDRLLPTYWVKVTHKDYSGCGFDRGHLCPSGDRNANTELSKTTFVTTNIIPQSVVNNEVTWNNLESVEQQMARDGYEMYIYAGPIGRGGISKKGALTDVIGSIDICVPAYTWKIIIAIPEGSNDMQRLREAEVIAVIIPNSITCHMNAVSAGFDSNNDWKYYITNIDEIERITGYDFLSNVDSNTEAILEAKKYR